MIKNEEKVTPANQTEIQKALSEVFTAADTVDEKFIKALELNKKSAETIRDLEKERADYIRHYDKKIKKEKEDNVKSVAVLDIPAARQDLIEKIKAFCEKAQVTNSDLALLLEKETGKKWKVCFAKEYKGDIPAWKDYFNMNFYVMNEDVCIYDKIENGISISHADKAELIFDKSCECFGGESSVHRKDIDSYSEKLSKTNWLLIYLVTKYNTESFAKKSVSKFTIDTITPIGKTIYKVLEDYVNNLTNNAETSGENE